MKHVLLYIVCGLLLSSCNLATPENYFDLTVLNCNMINGFASDGQAYELEHPSEKLVAGTKDKTIPMKRKEIIDSKIQFVENNLKKEKELKETPETKEMLQTAIALHTYVLGVYKNEYQQLAKLYDDGASKQDKASLTQTINNTYYSRFDELLNKLVSIGKPYAKRNNIAVDWH